jgi:hypothetical protein
LRTDGGHMDGSKEFKYISFLPKYRSKIGSIFPLSTAFKYILIILQSFGTVAKAFGTVTKPFAQEQRTLSEWLTN